MPSLETDVAEVSGSSDEEDVPPPLPPPRTESLRRPAEEGEETGDGGKEVTEPYNSAYRQPLGNGSLQSRESVTGSSTESSSVENSPNKCILTSGKLEEKKR